jgi:transcriptional regulator with XRE-family HTH domain
MEIKHQSIRNLAQDIKAKRIDAKMSVTEVARRAGLSRSYLYDIESGRTNPSLKVLTALQTVLGVQIWSLCEEPLSHDEFVVLQCWREKDYSLLLQMIANQLKDETP